MASAAPRLTLRRALPLAPHPPPPNPLSAPPRAPHPPPAAPAGHPVAHVQRGELLERASEEEDAPGCGRGSGCGARRAPVANSLQMQAACSLKAAHLPGNIEPTHAGARARARALPALQQRGSHAHAQPRHHSPLRGVAAQGVRALPGAHIASTRAHFDRKRLRRRRGCSSAT
jgi:hypothetical protein